METASERDELLERCWERVQGNSECKKISLPYG